MCLYEKQIKMEQAVDVHTLVHKCTTINMYVVHTLNLTYTCIAPYTKNKPQEIKSMTSITKLNKINFFHSIQVFVKMTIFDEDRIVQITVHIQFNHIT